VGEISDNEKDAFLRNAYALFLLIDWPGPFVLVMIEATAYRTLVFAYCHGSIPELVENGITGFMIDGLEAARRAAGHIPTLSQTHRRPLFEPRLSVSRMAEDYLAVYQQLIDNQLNPVSAA
jgi:glycosyltransferase involved in cell wall biosynthesis